MKRTSFLPIIFLLTCYVSNAQSLEEYRWKKRLIFIANPDMDQHGGHPQIKAFEGFGEAIEERDILVYIISENRVLDLDGREVDWDGKTVPYSSFQGIVLMGKDGGIKLKESFVISAREIFDLIDSMPMRRAEMKNSVKD